MTQKDWESATQILKAALDQIDAEIAKKTTRIGALEIVVDSFELDIGAAILLVAIDHLHSVYLAKRVQSAAGKYVAISN